MRQRALRDHLSAVLLVEDDDAEVVPHSEAVEVLEDTLQAALRCRLGVVGVQALAVVEGRQEETNRLGRAEVVGKPHGRPLDEVPSVEVMCRRRHGRLGRSDGHPVVAPLHRRGL